MAGIYRKFAAVMLGIGVCIVLLEAVLSAIGQLHLKTEAGKGRTKNEDNETIILCVGDSFTRGIGAVRGKGYPQQLEQLLNKAASKNKFRVINRGFGSFNSTMVKKRFSGYVKEAKPQLVILLAGATNVWDAWGYHDYLHKESFWGKIEDSMHRIKTFKLLKLLVVNIKNKMHEASHREVKLASAPPYGKGSSEGKNRVKDSVYIQSGDEYFNFGYEYFRRGAYANAKKHFKVAIQTEPATMKYYTNFAMAVLETTDEKERRADIEFLYGLLEVQPKVKDLIAMLTDREKYLKELERWISFDLEEMVHICKEHNIKVVLQSYPVNPKFPYLRFPQVNAILRNFADKHSIAFVDNEKIFNELTLGAISINDYFMLGDCHCNALGYGLMAENLFDALFKEKVLELNPHG